MNLRNYARIGMYHLFLLLPVQNFGSELTGLRLLSSSDVLPEGNIIAIYVTPWKSGSIEQIGDKVLPRAGELILGHVESTDILPLGSGHAQLIAQYLGC